ncbi:hypothetical protein LSAT2_008511 [Lamellibrachia satsuma]|nr:hypothetical protein LSAT2_008511 [Lamellibrachia satsuma]
MCVNGAGLTTINSSEGVTIVTTSPNADNVATEMDGTETFGDTSADVPAVKSSQQDTVGIKWEKPSEEEHIDSVCKTLRIKLRTCTKAHRCSQVPVKPILIVRDSDTLAETKEGQLMLTLARTDDPEKIVIIKAVEPQANNTMLVGGLLSEEDVNSQYDSAESDSFKSFIVDPVSTQDKTDRYLRNSASVCETGSKKDRSKRAVLDSGGGSGAGLYSVGSVDNTFSNSPPVITSESYVNIFKDDQFIFDIAADDSDGDDLYFLLNSTSSPPMGNVTLRPKGKPLYQLLQSGHISLHGVGEQGKYKIPSTWCLCQGKYKIPSTWCLCQGKYKIPHTG